MKLANDVLATMGLVVLPEKTKQYSTAHRKLHKDVALLISNQLELTDAVNLALSDKFYWEKTGPRVRERVRAYAQEVIEHLVLGRFEAGKAMIQKIPKSLFWKAKVKKDYAGHSIVGADGKGVHPYEVALLNGHVELAQSLARLFTDKNLGMPEGAAEKERLRQHTRQLPQGFFVLDETTYTVDYFKTKMQAAVEGDAEALAQLREDFKPREIRAGTPMRHQALVNAHLAFAAKWEEWDRRLPHRRMVWNTFICTILRNVSAREAQECARGLNYVKEWHEHVPDSFQLRDESGVFFPLPVGNNGLGFNLDFDYYWGAGHGCFFSTSLCVDSHRVTLWGVYELKSRALAKLNEPEDRDSKSWCTLC